MADAPTTLRIGENSPEYVALRLLQSLAVSEGLPTNGGVIKADRKWLLDTYAECLLTVRHPENRLSNPAQVE